MEDSETTNAVLKEMIIGLTKITDDRLLNLKDSMAEIKLLIQGFATKIELDEAKRDFNLSIKRIEDGFRQHNIDDKESFGGLSSGQKEVRDTLLKWGAVLGFILLALSFTTPIILRRFFGI